MTKNQANELKVGIVVLVCLGLGLGVAMKLSNWEQWFKEKNTLTFKVPYQAGIGGVKPGWPVTIGGVGVGSVEEIWLTLEEIDPRDGLKELQTEQTESEKDEEQAVQNPEERAEGPGLKTYSYFKFTIPTKYQLREDCKLTPVSQLIGGAGELQIADLGKGALLQDGQTVFRKDLGGSSMAEVMDTVQAAMNNIRKITEDFKDVSSKARETVNLSKPQLEKIISNVREASAEMKAGMREIRWNPWRLLHNPTDRELRTQNLLTAARAFSSGASDVDAAVGKLEGLLAAREDDVSSDDPQVKQMLDELRATMVKFNEAAETFFKRLGKAR